MIYVDKGLCTGCGICVAACNRAALSLRGNAAVIDESLCTSCGRCLEACLAGAIISMEINPLPASTALAERPEAQPVWSGSPSLPPTGTAVKPIAAQPPAISKLDLIERVFNGLFSIATYALDRKRGHSSRPAAATDRAGNAAASAGSGGRGCPGGRQDRRTRQLHGLGGGLGGGRGLKGCGKQGGPPRLNRRNRAT